MNNQPEHGHIHPITRVYTDLVNIFEELGFAVAQGNEVETEHYNFDALNIPDDHPARDMQDTFWLKNDPGNLLRTQTSSVQIHYMEEKGVPAKIVVPGKVFRNEATDRTHEIQFHQMEGLLVGEGITLAHLKYTLDTVLKKLFGEETETRLRPGYFPFVEPGVEIDMKYVRKNADGNVIGDEDAWIEILGAGMVHPKVLEAAGINPRKYTGFAFGMGIDRIAMLKYKIDDVRLFYNGDMRLVSQF